MESKTINNIGELRSEIIRLQAEVDQRELAIQHEIDEISEQVKAPFQFFKRISSWFGGGEKAEASEDWTTALLRLGLPYLMNETFFKRSGIIMKTVIGLLSQKVVQGINYDTITSWIQKLNTWVKKQGQKKEETEEDEFTPNTEAS